MLEVRQARQADWPKIEQFVRGSYGKASRFKGLARWRWQMADGPYPLASESDPPSWIALDGESVVGQISLQPGRFWSQGRAIEIGWIVDVMVLPSHRGRGVAQRIYQAIVDSGTPAVTLTMAEATRRIAERTGCITLPPVYQLLRCQGLSRTTLGTVLDHSSRWGALGRGLAVLARTGLGAAAARALTLAARRTLPRMAAGVGDVDRCNGDDIGRLFETARTRIPALFDRSPEFWRWRFERAPDLDYRFAERRIAERVAGVVVWRMPTACELPVGTIVEILCDPDDEDTISALAAYAARQMAQCEAIVAGASHPAFLRAYRKCGFFTVKTHRPTVSASADILAQFAHGEGSWHFSKADHDWDQVHPV